MIRKVRRGTVRFPPVLVLVLALALAGLAAASAYRFKATERDYKMNEVTLRISTAIEDRLRSYGNVLLDLRGFLQILPRPASKDFARFVESLNLSERYPGLIAIGYARPTPGPGNALHIPVVYLQPTLHPPSQTLGYDMAADPGRRQALELARDSGRPTLSQPLPGAEFLLAVPVYRPAPVATVDQRRQALVGYVYGTFRGHDILDEVAAEQGESLRDVSFAVYDGSTTDGQNLVYDGGSNSLSPRVKFTHKTIHKNMNNREWTLDVRAAPAFFGEKGTPYYVWVILADLLAGLIIFLYARTAAAYAASLEKSESMLSLVTDSLPGVVSYVSPDHRYLYNNKAYFTWWGLTPAQLYGKKVSETLGSSYERFFKPLLDRALKGERVTFEHSQEMPNSPHGRRYFRGDYIPDRTSDGRIQGVVAVVNDQTEQKLFQDKLRDEQRLTELVNQVGLILQSELNLESLAQKITDLASELSGSEVGAFLYGERLYAVSGPLRDEVGQILKQAPSVREIFRASDSAKLAPLCSFEVNSYLSTPVVSRSGETLGGLLFVHTRAGMFTERTEKLIGGIAAQAAVALDNARLYSEAKNINRVKDEFLATLSHELRTPMNVILGYSELLKEEPLSDAAQSYVDTIFRNAKAQNQLIADLLDISAIITGKLAFSPMRINAAEVVRNAIENIRFAAEAKGVSLVEAIPMAQCSIVGDATRVQQIVWNLLSNAVKFTPVGGRVEVQVRINAGRCEIEVTDSGIGIRGEFLPYIFERFSQEDSGRSRRFGGLGLGLSIVRQLVELHGGQIRVESEGKDKGSRFVVWLPLAVATDVQLVN